MSGHDRKDKESSDYEHLLTEPDLEDPDEDYDGGILQHTSSSYPRAWHIFRLPFRHAIRIVVSLPLGAFLFCVVYAMYTDYEKATYTLCTKTGRKIRNYLPSLSAAVGDFHLSKLVWKLCIFLHAAPRFLFASMYFRYLCSILGNQYVKWAFLACALHVIEIMGLIGLTLISSKQNLLIHAICFAIFVVTSELYMIILCVLLTRCRKTHTTHLEAKSLYVKKQLTKLILVSSILLFIVYFRHEDKCEEGVYTIFALVEYILVIANMAFHLTAYWDFYDRIIILDLCRPLTIPSANPGWKY